MEELVEIVKERLKKNEILLKDGELKKIDDSIVKIYLLGLIDGKKIYN